MTPYATRLIHLADQALFLRIEKAVQALTVEPVSCHQLAQVVYETFSQDVIMQHGRFMTLWEHSWLKTAHDNIIDVYPVALIGGPILVDGHEHSPWREAYTVLPVYHIFEPESLARLNREFRRRVNT